MPVTQYVMILYREPPYRSNRPPACFYRNIRSHRTRTTSHIRLFKLVSRVIFSHSIAIAGKRYQRYVTHR